MTTYTLVRHLDETHAIIMRSRGQDTAYGITPIADTLILNEIGRDVTSWHSTIDAAVEAYANSKNV